MKIFITIALFVCFLSFPSVCSANLINGFRDTSQDAIDFFRYDVFGGHRHSGYRHNSDNFDHGSPVPEPATIILMSAGIAGIVALKKKKQKTAI